MNYASCRLLAIVSFMRLKLNLCRGNVFISCQSKTFDSIYAPCCRMPHSTHSSCENFPAFLSLSRPLSLQLPLSRSNCKRYWRLKYLIQQLHDGKTRPVYYCVLCVCKCVCSSGCVCAVSWPVWLIKWRAKPTHLTPDRAKRGPFPQMSFCQAERNVRNKF